MDIHALRKDYKIGSLDVEDVLAAPISQFRKWFDEALNSEILEANAMVLSTVSPDMKPHSRIVLVKDINTEGLSFFTNYLSNKGKQLADNQFASLLFFWPELERQVRLEGTVEKLSREASEQYFHSRPRSSQIGAHVSPQSTVIPDRAFLEDIEKKLTDTFKGQPISLPDHWGGYLFVPTLVEFWQGRPSRLHDRVLYTYIDGGSWKIERLAP